MSSRRELLTATGLLGASLSGCVGLPGTGSGDIDPLTPGSTPSQTTTPPWTPAPAEPTRLVTGNTGFALDLHGRVAASDEGANALTAPYSVSTALSMTYARARGATAEEMAATLRFDLPRERLHPALRHPLMGRSAR